MRAAKALPRVLALGGWLLLGACATQQAPVSNPGTVNVPDAQRDSGPSGPIDVSHIPDAVPRAEVRTRAGNYSPYTVLGKTYRVMAESRGFRETGTASWYGRKFHGRRTSNGEIYDMYAMTAAHKTLPIPSYVRVTNQSNGRQVIVRVNDRGPFHGGRIIDLSYSAAAKLGYADRGTAPVTVEVVEAAGAAAASPVATGTAAKAVPAAQKAPVPASVEGYQLPANTFLQAGAFGSLAAAELLRERLRGETQLPVLISQAAKSLFRVRIGPFSNNWELMNLRERLQKKQLASPHVVYD